MTEDFHVSEEIRIKSHRGIYSAVFDQNAIVNLNNNPDPDAVYLIDTNISNIYNDELDNLLKNCRVLLIDAKEENKSLNKLPDYINELVNVHQIRRGQALIAVGGGITQDITCFLASTLMRGLPWYFYPTTLLAQADSCIGSKSSINSGEIKNILGTFTPPDKVIIDVHFLSTLESRDIHSGIGEMIKVHAINSPESFDRISKSYDEIIKDKDIMEKFIYESLLMKKKLIEIDEFDQGPRNVMNYGHSFGHAIESATNFAIPHGVAVTIGMDVANYIAFRLGISEMSHYERMHSVMNKNYRDFVSIKIDIDKMLNALTKDKKNTASHLRLILPDKEGKIKIVLQDNNAEFKSVLNDYFERVYA